MILTLLRAEFREQRLEKWKRGGAFLGDQSQDIQQRQLTTWGLMKPLWVPVLCSSLLSPCGCQFSHPDRHLPSPVCQCLGWDWHMVWITK